MERLWPLITVIGPILLAAVILYAILRNRLTSASERSRTERATKALYAEEDRLDKD